MDRYVGVSYGIRCTCEGQKNMRPTFYLLVAHVLLLLGLIVPMNSVTAGVLDELRTKLDEV